MPKHRSFSILALLVALLLTLTAAMCDGGEDHARGPDAHTHAAEEEDHEHGEGTHTHEALAADTAGTHVDTTGAFFDDEPETDDHDHDDAHGHDHDGDDGHEHD